MAAKEKHFAEFFVTEATHCIAHFLADDFHEIWTQNVNQCDHENLWNRILKFFRTGHFL